MTVALVDPSLFGTDVRMIDDVDQVWGIASGYANLARAIARRLITDRFGLFYDPTYGYNVTNLLNAGWTPTLLSKAQQDIAAEVEKDDRVRRCRATVVFNESLQTLRIDITCDTEAGPFSMVMGVSAVTVEILKVNGVQATETVAAVSGGVVIVSGGGGGGEPGPPGPPGPGGSAQSTISFGDTFYFDASGAETWQAQREINMGSLPASLTVEFVAQVKSVSGTATFRLRLGGGDEATDGSVIATITATSASYEEKVATASLANPNGLKRLKVTIESNGANEADIKNITVTFR